MSATAGPVRPPAPLPARPFAPPPFVTRTMSTGLTLSAARWGKRPTVAVSILFPGAGNTGDPAGKEGTSEITADTFLGGTATRTSKELAEAIDDMAAILEVSAGADAAVARLFVLEKDLDEGLALLAEVVGTPSFPEEEVEKSRRRQIDLLVEQRSEPDFLAR
ncbi:MAG TPA: insulinase family protein, partial [Thermoanaerobaculia bacterium]|nr:insulinase family protein [Thermoanaerobaculia bacterium]